VLLPGFPNPIRLSVTVDIDKGTLPLAGISSSLHATATEDAPTGLRVRLNPAERADRDFLLRLRYGTDDAISTSLSVLADGDDGGTFALTVLPPTIEATARGRDVVLVLDRSGSMGGWKMVAARRAASRIVDTLSGTDRLTVLAFDHQVDTPPSLPAGLVEASDRNRFRAVEFLSGLDARGGTEMLVPLRRAADLLREAPERDRVLVLVTDGQIGNEDELLRELSAGLTGVRVHTVGIDRAVNEAFLQRLAGSSGRYELVESEDRLDDAMQHIHRRIGAPVVTGLHLSPARLAVDTETVAPTPLPDLFTGAPVVIMGRFTGEAAGAITVTGDGDWRSTVTASVSDNPSLAALWARARIRDLEDRYVVGTGDRSGLEKRIVDTSLRFGVLSRFTAFVAVDQRVVNEGGKVHRVTQPVDLPSGWEPPAVQAGGFAPTAAAPMARSMPRYGSAPAALASGELRARGLAADGLLGGHRMPPSPQSRPVPKKKGRAEDTSDPVIESARRPVLGEPVPGDVVPEWEAAPGVTPPVVPPPTVSLADFVAAELKALKAAATLDVWTRAGLLAALSERIRVLLTGWQVAGEPKDARVTLGTLSTELAVPTADASEVDRHWHHMITTLTSLTSTPQRKSQRTFWKH
jgi:Ca-activated chloride channel family protein